MTIDITPATMDAYIPDGYASKRELSHWTAFERAALANIDDDAYIAAYDRVTARITGEDELGIEATRLNLITDY